MNETVRKILRIALVGPLLGTASLPGFAHGDEPHGDAPAAAASSSPGTPRFEATTTLFEVVGQIDNGALTLFVNRFATNEPVLQAKVVLADAMFEAEAEFQPEQGSYVVRDEPFVAALSQPGTHDLTLTVTAGDDADLLETHLVVAAAPVAEPSSRDSAVVRAAIWGPAAVGVLALIAALLRRRRSIKKGVAA